MSEKNSTFFHATYFFSRIINFFSRIITFFHAYFHYISCNLVNKWVKREFYSDWIVLTHVKPWKVPSEGLKWPLVSSKSEKNHFFKWNYNLADFALSNVRIVSSLVSSTVASSDGRNIPASLHRLSPLFHNHQKSDLFLHPFFPNLSFPIFWWMKNPEKIVRSKIGLLKK